MATELNRMIHWSVATLAAGIIILALTLAFVAPPFIGQDELYHWQRALQVSDGNFLARRLGDNKWGGAIDKAAYDFCLWPLKHFQDQAPIPLGVTTALAEHLAKQPRSWATVDFSSTATFSPLAYVPQAIGIAVARAIGGSLLHQVTAGRIANLSVYGAMLVLIWTTLPAGRKTFLALAFLPTFVVVSTTLSADPMNFTLPALFFAWCWRCRQDREVLFATSQRVVLLAFMVGLSQLKPIYILFGAFAVTLPERLFASRTERLLTIGLSLAVGLGCAVGWNLAYPFIPGKYWGTGADPMQQVTLLLSDPKTSAWTFYSTVRDWHGMWWLDSTLRFGGHPPPYSWYGPHWLSGVILIGLLLVVTLDAGEIVDPWFSVVCVVLAIVYFIVLMLAFWIGFTRPGSPTIDGLQGRYFMLFYLLLSMAALTLWPIPQVSPAMRFSALALAMVIDVGVLIRAVIWMMQHWAP